MKSNMTPKEMLPKWIEQAGESKEAWVKWFKLRVASCLRRKNNSSTKEEWQKAILTALKNCKGRGYYSNYPLSLRHYRKWQDPMWPSVDHVEGPAKSRVVIETRLVNDMKTILDEKEFDMVIRHLNTVDKKQPLILEDDWRPRRSY